MADLFINNLGYDLADCFCGEKPEFVSRREIYITGNVPYLYFEVRCPKCGRTSGSFVDEADAVFQWNRYMKRKPKEYYL